MNDDNKASVSRRFPLLFADMQEDHDIALGFEVGEGWIPLLERLFEQLETLIAAEPVADQPNYRAVQIKEKFGGLRVYLALAGRRRWRKQSVKPRRSRSAPVMSAANPAKAYRSEVGC